MYPILVRNTASINQSMSVCQDTHNLPMAVNSSYPVSMYHDTGDQIPRDDQSTIPSNVTTLDTSRVLAEVE